MVGQGLTNMIGNAITGGGPAVGGGGGAFTNTCSVEFAQSGGGGIDDYVEGSATFSALDGLAKGSFSYWIKPIAGTPLTQSTFGINKSGGTGTNVVVGMWLYQGNRIEVNLSNTGVYVRGNISGVTYGSWNHIVLACDGSQALNADKARIYVNGSDVTTINNLGSFSTFQTSASPLRVGDSATGYQNPVKGHMDEFAVWANLQLSSSDVTALYNSGTPTDLSTFSTQPTLWWRMGDNDGCTGTTITGQGLSPTNASLINGANFSSDVP